ncbi:MAG: ATP-binding cassette domain-containing protein, partial [Candidatus Cloacimonetes bacterium]|nr:ATP-binding cassette domain-containing protein [Candidatus Cloacimonadota bacterium]
FQSFNLFPHMTVLENIIEGPVTVLKQQKNEAIPYAEELLDWVGLTEKRDEHPSRLSGGQQQRVAIARALMQNPQLILADEPVASLDPATADSVMRYLGELNKKDDITVICSLHFLSLARKYGTRVIALKDGKIVFDGTPTEIDEIKFKEIYGEDAEEVEIR